MLYYDFITAIIKPLESRPPRLLRRPARLETRNGWPALLKYSIASYNTMQSFISHDHGMYCNIGCQHLTTNTSTTTHIFVCVGFTWEILDPKSNRAAKQTHEKP